MVVVQCHTHGGGLLSVQLQFRHGGLINQLSISRSSLRFLIIIITVIANTKTPLEHLYRNIYSQTCWSGQQRDLIISIHFGRVPTYLCFIFYIVPKRNQTNDIHLTIRFDRGGLLWPRGQKNVRGRKTAQNKCKQSLPDNPREISYLSDRTIGVIIDTIVNF